MTYAIDFEFLAASGERPRPWCMCWVCVETGEEGRLWIDGEDVQPPEFTDDDLVIAHYALAEMTCYEALGWKMPPRVIDTLAEARVVRGQVKQGGWGLLKVCESFGIATMSGEHKEEMREVAMATSVAPGDRAPLMEYCLDDCRALAELWRRMGHLVDIPQAELRGRYLKALACVEGRGVPADSDLIRRLEDKWPEVRKRARGAALETYPGTFTEDGSFSATGWLRWCADNKVSWPLLPSGAPQLDEETFRRVAGRFPQVEFMRNTRRTLSASRAVEFPRGHDSRLRCMLSPFGSDTGRNQPSNARYVFGMAAWLRRVIQAPAGKVLAYVDYASQEFAIAGALSGDEGMIEDYLDSDDPYLSLARRANAVPADATKQTHAKERAAFKETALGVQFGMGAYTLSGRLGMGQGRAAELVAAHKEAYRRYWTWREALIDHVLTGGKVETRYGWRRKAGPLTKGTSIGNFLVQSTGAEILRLAITALEERGHKVVAPVHDAVLVEMEEQGHEQELEAIRAVMKRAGRVVTGVTIRTDAELVAPLDHFEDGRGREMWEAIGGLV